MIHVYQRHMPHDYFVTKSGDIYPELDTSLHDHGHLDIQLEFNEDGPTEAQLQRLKAVEIAFAPKIVMHTAPSLG